MKVLLTQLRVRSEDAGENFRGVARLLKLLRIRLSHDDILVLPELIGGESERKHYERSTSELACSIGCHVVGGTNHHKRRGKIVNSGVVADPQGKIVAAYDKLHPYSIETRLGGVAPGALKPAQGSGLGFRLRIDPLQRASAGRCPTRAAGRDSLPARRRSQDRTDLRSHPRSGLAAHSFAPAAAPFSLET